MLKTFLTQAPAIACVLTLAACATPPGQKYLEHRDPSVGNIDVSVTAIPEATAVTVPVPIRQPQPAPKRAERASVWNKEKGGFFADYRASDVGDILTILIAIDDEAKLRNASDRSRSSENEFEGSTVFADPPAEKILDLSSSSSSNGEGSINRQEKINLKVAAMVIQRLANDNLVVAGRQEVKVNNELRELRVAGIIRPSDIGMDNSIPYDRIAEARITYGGRGQLSRVQQPRYGEDALDVILPY
ncbi:flagellar basal body L-ring protein FlgH [Paracoccus ravus]|uniref:flagellar basal body L-ring protein FlgH n=1 Tax=Paracoccus ravus TaxID=2447760 RepID=UPI00106E204E|nr:flagellar basal body L-ring protein FlgH [Paracoccus ravus]